MEEMELSSTPSKSTSRPSLNTTVPSARKACSKSNSVLETRLFERKIPFAVLVAAAAAAVELEVEVEEEEPWKSLDPIGCKPEGKDDGGTGDRGEGCLNNEATVSKCFG